MEEAFQQLGVGLVGSFEQLCGLAQVLQQLANWVGRHVRSSGEDSRPLL
jgi:hypothetical protein